MGAIKKKRRKKVLRKNKGFTLIEILVVFGILAMIMSITLVAVNPAEQANRANDISARATAEDFIKASTLYYTEKQILPWTQNSGCLNEVALGGPLSAMPNCVEELAQAGALKDTYLGKAELNKIHLNRCEDSAVICYSPKSKEEYQNATYDKFGVNKPGCPGTNNNSEECYWCKPVVKQATCTVPTPTPTTAPTPTSTVMPTPTPTIPQVLSGYTNDESKFFQTYAVYFFDHPGFAPSGAGWNMHISLRPDFGGDYTQTYKSFGIPSHYSQDAPLNVSYAALRKITSKYVGFASITKGIHLYDNGCGKTIYWRIANYYNDSATDKKVGPTYTGIIDCTTKVGMVDPPLSWYTVYDQLNGKQKMYDASWDFDKSGAIDWTDYWLGAFSTKTRAGGWQPPE